MSVFDFTFPGTAAQALYLEDALHAIHATGWGEQTIQMKYRFPWMGIFDAKALALDLILADVRISHDAARMEIRVSPGGDEDDMDFGPDEVSMSHDAVAAALLGMKWEYAIDAVTAFTFVNKKDKTGGTIAVSRKEIRMETFAETAQRLAGTLSA